MNTLLTFFLTGLAGFLFSTLRKFISLRRKGRVINYDVTLYSYLRQDWDYFSTIAWAVGYAKIIFLLIGAIGAEVLNTFFSQAEKEVISRIKRYGTAEDDRLQAYGGSGGTGGGTNPDPIGLPPKP
jgi:hypothetical protein